MNKLNLFLKWIVFLLLLCRAFTSTAQEEQENETRLESMAEKDEGENEDETALQQMALFKKHPLNINAAEADDLASLIPLSAQQIDCFLKYRKLLGKLISLYELQAVPGWDVDLIHDLLPYITVEEDKNLLDHIKERLAKGDHTLLLRISQVPERSKGYLAADTVSHYEGSPQKLYMRYQYNYKNLLQFGILGEKDAGEPFLKGKQRYGFDFYSGYFFLRKAGIIKALALGDFTVSMGQGLIHWQGMGSGKGADVLNIKKQSAVLKPYHSAGEFNFMRGAGIVLSRGKWESSGFVSRRSLDASLEKASGQQVITSVNTSGYHRTASESAKKANTRLATIGGNIKYNLGSGIVSVNLLHYKYSDSILKRDDPYNLYAIKGKSFTNLGTDYNYTIQNIHFFGEIAFDKNRHAGILNGLLLSPDERIDLALIYRHLHPAFQSIYGNGFTENTLPANESGLYSGVSIRLRRGLSLAAYADVFHFPWLKYRVDAPSFGRDYMIKVAYKPDKKTEVYIRYRSRDNGLNESEEGAPMPYVQVMPRQNLWVHANMELFSGITIRSRCEMNWYGKDPDEKEQGFLWLTDMLYKPLSGSWSGNIRFAYFNTASYNTRMYAFENDVLYASAIAPLFGKGNRYYLNIRKKIPLPMIKRVLNIYMKWSQNLYKLPGIGSGLDEINDHKKSEIKIQAIII